MLDVRLIDHPFNPGMFVGPFTNAHPGLGGVCTFVGEVRGVAGAGAWAGAKGEADGAADVAALELTHYAPLTLPAMQALGARAVARFGLMGLLIVHRVGVMHPGEPIVLVSACAVHRRGAIDAVDYTMDHLKSCSWLWKRERRGPEDGGSWHWIEPRADDHAGLARWGD